MQHASNSSFGIMAGSPIVRSRPDVGTPPSSGWLSQSQSCIKLANTGVDFGKAWQRRF